MRFLTRVILFFALCCMALPAQAQGPGTSAQNTPASAQDIALIYHRLIGQMPDFNAWIKASDDYVQAGQIDQQIILETRQSVLRNAYERLNLGEPFYIDFLDRFSSYKEKFQGYFIYDLTDDFFIPFKYNNENYVVVTNGIDRYQWIYTPKDIVTDIEKKLDNNRAVSVQISLVPLYADRNSTITIDDKIYKLILARVIDLKIRTADASDLIWTVDVLKRPAFHDDDTSFDTLKFQ